MLAASGLSDFYDHPDRLRSGTRSRTGTSMTNGIAIFHAGRLGSLTKRGSGDKDKTLQSSRVDKGSGDKSLQLSRGDKREDITQSVIYNQIRNQYESRFENESEKSGMSRDRDTDSAHLATFLILAVAGAVVGTRFLFTTILTLFPQAALALSHKFPVTLAVVAANSAPDTSTLAWHYGAATMDNGQDPGPRVSLCIA
ncbi:hypothetical protein EDB85DRAFT_1894838 [Lactarius pseudohatsudake]|nr:hypothetical protein EDB85DRAFT_1894838 [Lactarius pseudohatsudake]